jgi:tripartite-type tricarboxylate transporter receptor subunit TctC
MSTRLMVAWTAAVLCLGVNAGDVANAQSYPMQPIRIIVPSGPGGPNDVVARLASQFLSRLGQPAIVENRPGAGGALGAREVATARPDGYTLLVGNTATLAVIPAVYVNPGYDPIRSFTPVAKFWENYQILAVLPSFPKRTLKDFVTHAKANPGKWNYAHGGTGGLPHLAGELFKLRAGVDIVGVPYRSDVESATAVLGEAVQVTFANITVLLPLIREGKLRALGITSETRTVLAPDLPTVMEGGVPDYEVTAFFGIVAPAGTPDPIVRRLNTAINEGLSTAEMRATVARLGGVSNTGSPEDFGAFIASKQQKWTAIVKATGVTVE